MYLSLSGVPARKRIRALICHLSSIILPLKWQNFATLVLTSCDFSSRAVRYNLTAALTLPTDHTLASYALTKLTLKCNSDSTIAASKFLRHHLPENQKDKPYSGVFLV